MCILEMQPNIYITGLDFYEFKLFILLKFGIHGLYQHLIIFDVHLNSDFHMEIVSSYFSQIFKKNNVFPSNRRN